MNAKKATQAFRLGLLIHGNKIWISEFLGIIIVSTTLLVLFSLTFSILIDEAVIHGKDRKLSTLKNDSLSLSKSIADLSRKIVIAEALVTFSQGHILGKTCVQLADLVDASSAAYGYDPFLLLAVIHVESVFHPKAVGQYRNGDASGAFGLMQIKLETAMEIAKSLGITVQTNHDLFKPETNLAIGVGYLTRLIAQFHSFKLGLLAYNQGPAVVLEHLSTQTPLSINYYNKVLRSYYLLKKSAGLQAPGAGDR